MSKQVYAWIGAGVLSVALVAGSTVIQPREAKAQGPYPILDQIAAKVIAKYQGSTCEQLWEKKAAHAPQSMEEQQAIGFLRSDPQMRTYFINQIAPPIANKMFDCGMIP
jgi:hypothetical protein